MSSAVGARTGRTEDRIGMPEPTSTSDAVTVRIDRRGHPADVRTVTHDNRSSVEELLIGLADENEVMLGLERDERAFLIALDRAKATIGLDSLDGTYLRSRYREQPRTLP